MKKIITVICVFTIGFLNAQYPADTINFDDKVNWDRVDTLTYNTNNLWQVGTPDKINFSAANSLPNAMVTNLQNPYPINTNSSFVVGMDSGDELIFSHKFNTDKHKDGGYIKISPDQGLNWYQLPSSKCYPNCNGGTGWNYNITPSFSSTDTLYDGQFGFSGTQSSWKKDTISMCHWGIKTSFGFLVKFTFISDGIYDNKDGWMIDDINIKYVFQCPGAVNEINQQPLIISPNPFSDFTMISTDNNRYMHNASLSVKDISGREIYHLNNINDNKFILEKGNLNSGIYFFTVSEKGSVIGQGKVVVQ
ncbi:MAG: T9SS type A sorting domain-containing protein [Bacteroidetes bacterium]|nr:T9SS type A sorting domain-containing protein [Bacteroidota bacterium]